MLPPLRLLGSIVSFLNTARCSVARLPNHEKTRFQSTLPQLDYYIKHLCAIRYHAMWPHHHIFKEEHHRKGGPIRPTGLQQRQKPVEGSFLVINTIDNNKSKMLKPRIECKTVEAHHQRVADQRSRFDNCLMTRPHHPTRPSNGTPRHHSKAKKTLASLQIILFAILVTLSLWFVSQETRAQSLSILPSDFERLIMPCYLGGGSLGASSSNAIGASGSGGAYYNSMSSGGANGPQSYGSRLAGSRADQFQSGTGGVYSGSSSGSAPSSSSNGGSSFGQRPGSRASPSSFGYQAPAYYGNAATDQSNAGRSSSSSSSYLGSTSQQMPNNGLSSSLSGPGPLNGQTRDGLTNNLGQSVPRSNTIENFIALVSKIELANPRLANNPDQLIRMLLGRFRLDNYYYDVRARTPISDPDRRATDILPALMNAPASRDQMRDAHGGLVDQLLDHDEKCSMYFMLSHFVDKSTPSSPALGQMPVNQLAGAQNGQKPPSLQAAGTGYPSASANSAYSSGSAGQRFSGPSPSFGSPLTSNMNAFGSGISNTNPEMVGQRNQYGVNSPQLTGSQYNSALATSQLRNPNAAYPAASARPPYIDVSQSGGRYQSQQQQQQRGEDRIATEYGVVTISNQENSAIALNRVLLGLLAATTSPQTIRQLAPIIYPTQDLTSTPRLDEEIDPLFAVTLADLWAVSSIPKPGKPTILGDSGHWNDLMCPTSFALERSQSIRFTTAELLGGLDGLNLGMFRRRLISMRRQLRLSELLRIYYSKTGFKPQYPDVGVCQRSSIINTQLDELRRQSENYLRLYQLSLPTSDQEIATQIARLDAFRDFAHREASSQLEICQQEGGGADLYPMDPQDNCEIARADIAVVLDGSPQANKAFMQIVSLKLAQRVGLSRLTNSLSIMTNQQDSTGFGGAYSFNAIVKNSTNLGEIGCALVHDTSSSYQGGQITDATRMMEMFERALVNLDSEYLTRQVATNGGSSYNSDRQSSSYVSTWFNQADGGSGGSSQYYGGFSASGGAGGPQNTGGAKVIVWFNYGSQAKPSRSASGPTNWYPNLQQSSNFGEQQEYRFYEAKKYLRENFRGASILALSPNREDVKAFVYDEEHDIITDVASTGDGTTSLAGGNDPYTSQLLTTSSSSSSQQSSIDSGTYATLSGQADQVVSKLVRRMCTVPSVFQYPMCFRGPSDNTISVGYISPGRRQYWMMSPKTFFASRSVRLVFKVDGGRLKVCFGRKPNPDETAQRNSQQNGYQQQQQQSITFQQQQQQQPANGGVRSTTEPPKPSSDDYYTGLEYGVCKDVGQNQEIDFLISEPCYKKSIAECEPFYFVIRELSQPGEGDPNYMCRDDGCKRVDQAKFLMTHTGVSCNSAFKGLQANWFLIMISTLAASIFSLQMTTTSTSPKLTRQRSIFRSFYCYICLALLVAYLTVLQQVADAQLQGGVYDFGQGRSGEKRGNFTPSEMVAIILIIMAILGGLALTIGLCFYVTKRANQGMQPVKQEDY